MVDYYRILKISPKATEQEIKSAYRRLARKFHPDANNGSENHSREFAKIAKAYQILSSADDRARYDKQRLQAANKSDSVMFSDNPHARRLRRMAVQKRMDAIVDRMIERERREQVVAAHRGVDAAKLWLCSKPCFRSSRCFCPRCSSECSSRNCGRIRRCSASQF